VARKTVHLSKDGLASSHRRRCGSEDQTRTGSSPSADSRKKRLGVGCTADIPACPLAQTWTGALYAAGRMFWFTRKKLVGSYFFLTAARRS
jgi:hypothetical protein